jgi:3-hydroxyisobutyrate dehydrogenase-like beta-hydroxyacid dehydrogenase
MQNISVIGLGDMGSALAHTLLNQGYAVTVWNRSAQKAEPLVSAGAALAASASDAVAASSATITCIKSHRQTRELLAMDPAVLKGKTIIELSTGDASDAEDLVAFLESNGADYLLGMINAYPSKVGEAETTIITVGPESTWAEYQPVIMALGGKSTYVGDQPAALAVLFAALFTTRQSFMFGMIYGALACQKAGIPLDAFVDQIPVSIKVMQDYYELFAATVPVGDYSNPEASMTTYAAAIDDTLGTFKNLGARSELPQLMHDLVHQGVESGHGDKQLTVLVKAMGTGS